MCEMARVYYITSLENWAKWIMKVTGGYFFQTSLLVLFPFLSDTTPNTTDSIIYKKGK